jgi:hypothetical protein
VKHGRFLKVPEGPADMDRLWQLSEPISPTSLPDWLSPGDECDYRIAGAVRLAGLSSADEVAYRAERKQMADLGLVIEMSRAEPDIERYYLARPRRHNEWSIGICRGRSPIELDSPRQILTRDDVTDVAATSIADPFAICVAGVWHLFFEVWNWHANKGEIGHALSNDTLNWSYDRIVLAEPFHLSYPQVFAHGGEIYMIPESFQAGAVRLYQATPFPGRWKHVETLLKGKYLVDASVFEYGGRWWLFVDASPEQAHDTLRLFEAAAVTGPWKEHPASPVVTGDARCARPGGRVVEFEGRPVRFAQNCVPDYGTDVRAFVIDELTAAHYRERPAVETPVLGPSGSGWNAAGMHHIDAHNLGGEWVAFVDGWRRPAGEP